MSKIELHLLQQTIGLTYSPIAAGTTPMGKLLQLWHKARRAQVGHAYQQEEEGSEGYILGCGQLTLNSNSPIVLKIFLSQLLWKNHRTRAVRSKQVKYNVATQDFSLLL